MLEDKDFDRRTKPLVRWRAPHTGGAPYSTEVKETGEQRATRVVQTFEEEFEAELRPQARYLLHNVVHDLLPLYISTPLLYWEDMDLSELLDRHLGPPHYTPEVEFNATGLDYDDFLSDFAPIHRIHETFNKARVRIVGFSEEDMQELEQWVLEEGRAEAVDRRWNSTWTWERGDGTTFFIDLSTLWT